MNQEEFNQLFIREDGLNHILLSDVNRILDGLKADYGDVIKVESIGETWQSRPINMVTLDATNFFSKKPDNAQIQTEAEGTEGVENKNENQDGDSKQEESDTSEAKEEKSEKDEKLEKEEKSDKSEDTETTLLQMDEEEFLDKKSDAPAILITGATHSRELITVQMVLFTIMKLLQGGIVNNDEEVVQMLKNNKYYFIPVLNVDGLALIEETHLSEGHLTSVLDKRKNMGPVGMNCESSAQFGVDLNRNFGVDWKVNFADKKTATNECSEQFPGKKAFSEKESQAIKAFMESHKDEVKFVVNFHSNGNSFMWPFNGRHPNDIESRAPGVLAIVKEVAEKANFPPNLKTGNAFDVIEEKVGGDADDYVTATFKIPSVTSEIGFTEQFIEDWVVKSKEIAFDICKLNGYWLEYVFLNLPKFAQQLQQKQTKKAEEKSE